MQRRRTSLLLILLVVFSLSTQVSAAPLAKSAEAAILDVSGNPIGRVIASHNETPNVVAVEVEVSNLEPGFHAFHIHSVGACDASGDEPFSSAGDLLVRAGRAPSENIGEMPPLFVMVDGTARMMFETDTFDLGHLFDNDGAAVIIHAVSQDPEATLVSYSGSEEAVGDRVACAVFGAE